MKLQPYSNQNAIEVTLGNRNSAQLISSRLKFTSISPSPEDTAFYQTLFGDKVNMRCYISGARSPSQMQARCKGWNEKWENHLFSAFIIKLKSNEEPIGHLVIGHGDFEGTAKKDSGWSEIALVYDKKFWNSNYPIESEKDIGKAGFSGLGKEAVRAAIAYAKSLHQAGYKVPSDVTNEQRPEVEGLIRKGIFKETDCKRNSNGEISWVYLPFKELRATCAKSNVAGTKIFEKLFQKENHAKVTCYSEKTQRYLYTIDLSRSNSTLSRLLSCIFKS